MRRTASHGSNRRSIVTLGEEFPLEQKRLRELIAIYDDLPGGVGIFGATMIRQTLERADRAAISGDLVEMIAAFQEMKGCE